MVRNAHKCKTENSEQLIENCTSSSWICVRPSSALGTVLDGTTYRALLKWHLGIPLLPPPLAGSPCPLGCGAPLDPYGDHAVCCPKGKLWDRHQRIQDFFARQLQSRGIPHRLEISVQHDHKRDADIFLPHWEAGAAWAIDVSVCHPSPPSTEWSLPGSWSCLKDRADRKISKYSNRCTTAGARFSPFVLSVWGSLAPGSSDVWNELRRRLAAQCLGSARSSYLTELQQGLSLALFRGIANQISSLNLIRERGFGESLLRPTLPQNADTTPV